MAVVRQIRNPVEWVADLLKEMIRVVGQVSRALRLPEETISSPLPAVQKIEIADLRDVLARGYSDLGTYRTDAIFLAVIYPLAGLVLLAVALNYNLVPLAFPLASGFALIGPIAGLGLYELIGGANRESIRPHQARSPRLTRPHSGQSCCSACSCLRSS